MTPEKQALETALKLRDEIRDFGYWRSSESLEFLILSLKDDVEAQKAAQA